MSQRFLGKAFISFEYEHFRNYLLNLQERQPERLQLEGRQLSLSKAEHPRDILWFNLSLSKCS